MNDVIAAVMVVGFVMWLSESCEGIEELEKRK